MFNLMLPNDAGILAASDEMITGIIYGKVTLYNVSCLPQKRLAYMAKGRHIYEIGCRESLAFTSL